MSGEYWNPAWLAHVRVNQPYSKEFAAIMSEQRRAVPVTPITHRDKITCQATAAIPRALFDRIEAECRKRGISKSEFIRQAVQDALQFYPGE